MPPAQPFGCEVPERQLSRKPAVSGIIPLVAPLARQRPAIAALVAEGAEPIVALADELRGLSRPASFGGPSALIRALLLLEDVSPREVLQRGHAHLLPLLDLLGTRREIPCATSAIA